MDKASEVRKHLENDLFAFAQYINPLYLYGDIHRKVFEWLSDPNAAPNQLVLLPRAHLKSHCIAVWVVWQITREPWSTFVYLSAGQDLAEAQIYAIQNMMLSDRYRLLWPEMVNEKERDRDKWRDDGFNVDHPLRKARGVRDNTLILKTVGARSTGLHCDFLVYDDLVVPDNAYTATGRRDVQRAAAQFSSIKNPGAITKAVGTRYHPDDLYNDMINGEMVTYDEDGNETGVVALWDVFEGKLEDSPDQDGTGNYLWPRTMCPVTGEWYGFNRGVRAKVLAEYESHNEREQFFAQYYNDPNDPGSYRLSKEIFQYYDKKYLREENNRWYFKDTPLRIYAGMDVAGTGWNEKGGRTADYTAIAVVGVTPDNDIYVLDLDQFKTSDYNEYFQRIIDLHLYWQFRDITIETNTIGKQVKKAIDNLLIENGVRLTVHGKNRSRSDGSKQERLAAFVEPRYKQGKMFHVRGGYTPELEEQLILPRPRHDDLADALCIAIEDARPPGKGSIASLQNRRSANVVSHPRFGGRRR